MLTSALSSISRALSSASLISELHRAHGLVIVHGLDRSVFFSGKLIGKYAEFGEPNSSLSVFHRASPTTNVYQWNSIIRALTRNGFFSKSLELYTKMQESGILPDKFTFPTVINACAGILDLEMGVLVHNRVMALDFGSDLYICNALIDMYSRFGSMDKARQLFDEMRSRDLVSWNCLISGYSSNGRCNEALEAFYQLRNSGLSPDSFTFSSILSVCINVVAPREGLAMHGLAEKVGAVSEVSVPNRLMSMYFSFELPEYASMVFDHMIVRDSMSYNTMICGYYQSGLVEELVCLFMEMIKNFVPDSLTIKSVLCACVQLKDLHLGKFIHRFMDRTGFKVEITLSNILIDMYAKLGDLLAAQEVFEGMQSRDRVSWNSLINGYIRRGIFDNAMKLFKMMRMEAKADSVTYSVILSGSSQLTCLEVGTEIHSCVIKSGFNSDLSVGNALVDMYAKCGETNDAKRIFDSMQVRDTVTWNAIISGSIHTGDFTATMKMVNRMTSERVEPDSTTLLKLLSLCSSLAAKHQGKELHGRILRAGYESKLSIGNALIEMYSKCGTLNKSVLVFESMNFRDVVTWTALIYAYGMYGFGTKALEAFCDMEKAGIVPDRIAFLAIIYSCSHSCLVEKGLACFDRMKYHYNIEPQLVHYACVVDLLSRAGEFARAEKFIGTMPIKPDAGIWSSLLSACRAGRDMDIAERVSNKILELDPQNPGYSILVSNTYAAMGKWDEVRRIRKSVNTKRLVKDPGCSWIEIRRKIYVFEAGDRFHKQYEDVNNFLGVLTALIAKEGYVADLKYALQNVEADEKKQILCGHSERLAIVFGLLNSEPETPLMIMKNLRVCGDCHNFSKYVSKIVNRELLVRDSNRFHVFKDGACSCGDSW